MACVAPQNEVTSLPRCQRWARKANALSTEAPAPPTPSPEQERTRQQRPAACPSYIMQHYHSTGCCGGAFSWRAAMLDPKKDLLMCTEPREYRRTTMEDIQYSLDDKRKGGGPRVGPFQETIPGQEWHALPKYDFTTQKRSSAFNERMHVEWENHVNHILANNGNLPTASVVAKAGFRSCSPCCRDMLALARPTGKTFIMVDLAENDSRGTFHFVMGGKYLPVPKEACSPEEVAALKRIVMDAQDGMYTSRNAIYEAVMDLGAPIDEVAQAFYLGDAALLPEGCAPTLSGQALLDVLHAEHFARLPAEYGASILRDTTRPFEEQKAVLLCRARAKEMLLAAWAPLLKGLKVDLESYVAAAVAPLLPDDPTAYAKVKASRSRPLALQASSRGGDSRRWAVGKASQQLPRNSANGYPTGLNISTQACFQKPSDFDDAASMTAASTAMPDDDNSMFADDEEQDLGFDDPQADEVIQL